MSQTLGIAVAQAVTIEQWKAFVERDIQFAVVRCYRRKSPGKVDAKCAATMANALAAGLTDLDVYHVPDVERSPEDQADLTLRNLGEHDLSPRCVWLDVATKPSRWKSTRRNLDFIGRLANRFASHLQVGILTSTKAWDSITGNSNALSELPLWWASQGAPYEQVGGWRAPALVRIEAEEELDGLEYSLNARPLAESRAPSAPTRAAPQVTAALLDGYLGKHISQICGNGFIDNGSNHCAHFANHVMELTFGYTCKNPTHHAPAANLRVHETFARCGRVGAWGPPADLGPCFAFVTKTNAVHLAKKSIDNIPKKHIGIFCGDMIWHYSNANRKVQKQTPAEFAKHYAGDGFGLFYGEFPRG